MMKPLFHFKMFQILKKRKRNKIFKDKQKFNARLLNRFEISEIDIFANGENISKNQWIKNY